MVIWLYGEGNTDVTMTPEGSEGAMRILLRKVLRDRLPERAEIDIIGRRLPRLTTGSGYPRKVKLAIAQASTEGVDGVAVVIDRDGPSNAKRLTLLKEGRELVERDGKPLAWKTALGVAIEMLEAWLIADTSALAAIASISGAMPDPESMRHPKEELDSILESAQLDAAEAYDRVAKAADLNGDGNVGVPDLLILLAAWGECPPTPEECPADLNGDGVVGVADLLVLLSLWG